MARERERAERLCPPMRLAGGFGDGALLERALTVYFHVRVRTPWELRRAKETVRRFAAACHLADEAAEAREFDAYAAALYRTVREARYLPIRTGLAARTLPRGEALTAYLCLLAHEGHGAAGRLLSFLAAEAGYAREALCARPALMTEAGTTYGQVYDGLIETAGALFSWMEARGFSARSAREAAEQRAAGGGGRRRLAAILAETAEAVRAAEDAAGARLWPRRAHVLADEAEEMRRRFFGEAMNPRFIEGMAAHGRHGAMALAAYVERSCRWDAACHGLEGWMYEAFARRYALHPGMQDWMRAVCPGALRHLTGSLLSAARAGRWRASLRTRTELTWLYGALARGRAAGDETRAAER